MARPIKFLHLQKAELKYEVTIRGGIPANTVLELRRQVCKLTQIYPPDDIADSCLDFSEDCEGVMESLQKVRSNLDSLMAVYDEGLSNRTRSLLNHLYYRIQRVEKPELAEHVSLYKTVKGQFDDYYAEFSKLSKPKTDSNPDTFYMADDMAKTTSNLNNLNVTVHCDRGLSSDVSKLKFDGKTCVRSFIQKLEEFRLSKNIPDDKLMSLAYEIFTGDALHWFRAVAEDIDSWESLVAKLRNDFDIVDYDYRMISEIRNRTQGETENIIVYLSIMKGMFSRLSTPMVEKDQLEILLHNIRPCYNNVLANRPDIDSIHQLQQLCSNFEQIKARSANFREPVASSSKTLAPEFAYNAPSKIVSGNFNTNYKSYTDNASKTHANTNKVFAVSNAKFCYRCRVDTHSMKECPAPRDIFCFKCGRKDVRSSECPDCNGARIPHQKNE